MCKECFRHSNTATGIYCKPMCRPVQAEICFSSFLVPADVPRTGPLCHLGFPFLFALHRLGFSIRAILNRQRHISKKGGQQECRQKKCARLFCHVLYWCIIAGLIYVCAKYLLPALTPFVIGFCICLSFEAADQPPHENHPARPQARGRMLPYPYFTFWPLRC